MKYSKHIIIGAALIASLTGCRSEKTESPAQFTVTQPAFSDGSVAAKETVVTLDIPEDCELSAIRYVEGHDDFFLVSDRENVYGFDREGKYICQYGHKGQGPAEYLNMAASTVSPDGRIVICDSYADKMLYYDAKDGSFSSEVKLPVGSLKMVVQCGFVFESEAVVSRNIYNRNDSVYATVNLKDQTVTNFATAGVYTDNIGWPIGLHCFSIADGRTAYLKPLDPVIYTAPDEKWIEISTDQKVLTPDQRADIKDFSNMTLVSCMTDNIFFGYSDIYHLNDYVFLSLPDVEYAIININSMEMKRYEYSKSHGLTRIVGCDRQRNLLIGSIRQQELDKDALILYELEF